MQQRKEYWWNPYIETSNKCKRKRTDIVTWDDQEKWTGMEGRYSAYVNISENQTEDRNSGKLFRNLYLL